MAEVDWERLVYSNLGHHDMVAGSLALRSQIHSCHAHSYSPFGTVHLPGTLEVKGHRVQGRVRWRHTAEHLVLGKFPHQKKDWEVQLPRRCLRADITEILYKYDTRSRILH